MSIVADETAQAWTEPYVWLDGGSTWNPIIAFVPGEGKRGWFCVHASRGCEHCYAERMNVGRFGNGVAYKAQNRTKVKIEIHEPTLLKPLHWRKPRRVFPCSMTDLFGEWVTDEMLDRIFAVMALTSRHTYQVLTKRPERMREYLSAGHEALWVRWAKISCQMGVETMNWIGTFRGVDPLPWPLPNCWLGVSVEDQKTADERITLLLQTPAAVRWLSYEPALGPVDFRWCEWCGRFGPHDCETGYAWTRTIDQDQAGINWIVVGGESGPGARPFDLAWARRTVEQCREAEVPCFVKQLGARVVCTTPETVFRARPRWRSLTDSSLWGPVLRNRKGGDPSEWPEDLRVREMPGLEVTP